MALIEAERRTETGVHERLKRVGVIDVGSNSVRLVVFDGAARSPAYFYNEKILCGLGRGLQKTGRLNPEGKARAMAALERFSALVRVFDIKSVRTVATAAVREATDGVAFCGEVRTRTGLRIIIASGREEARLSAQGVLLGWPDADGFVCDMGGASMEIAKVRDGAVGKVESTPLGSLTIRGDKGRNGRNDRTERGLVKRIRKLRSRFPGDSPRLFLVGGSFRAIARLDMEYRGYPLKVLHEYRMSPAGLNKTLARIRSGRPEDLAVAPSISPERLEHVPGAARVLSVLVDVFEPEEIAISGFGIREGLLYESLPENLRRRDPLIEVCRAMETSSARFPGFGERLADWVSPLFPEADSERRRLTLAACLLHDVTWRAHPDYRAEVCFDNATRANLGGLDHTGRIFIGMSLFHRYSKSIDPGRNRALSELLAPEELQDAKTLGRAMRLGALLGGAATDRMGVLGIDSVHVKLDFSGRGQGIHGEAVQRRLDALARAVGKMPVVVL